MKDPTPADIHCASAFRISRIEFDGDPSFFTSRAEAHVREAIAHFIQGKKVQTWKDEHYVEKRMDLYVATPDEFWAVVNKKAEEIALRYFGRSMAGKDHA